MESEARSISPILRGLLHEAARDLITDWTPVQAHAASVTEVELTVEAICLALDCASDGILDSADNLVVTPSPLSRHLVTLLRRAVVRGAASLTPPPEAADLLDLLRAMEALSARLEPGWDRRFADQLRSPDGLELVVEVAHDLRSPLTSILFLAETLQRGRSGSVTPLQERQLGLIYSAAFGLSTVASDVIELARGGDRLVGLDPLPFSLRDIMVSVRDIVLPIAEEKGLRVDVVTPSRPFRIGHPVAINRILLNLATNALKFTDEGRVEITAEEPSHDEVTFTVRDTGRGIPPEAMAMLFEPFRRRQREREYSFSGSGLGLSICRKLVEAMGSELLVDTREGEGTRFSFTLTLPGTEQGPE